MKDNKSILICLFFVLSLTFSSKGYTQDIKGVLSTMPVKDREILESFFHRVIHFDQFAYTLFGDRPIALSGDFNLTPYNNILLMGYDCGGVFWNQWAIWEKYRENFPMKKYLLIRERSVNCSDVDNVIFINKAQFIKKVNQHADVFQKKLNRKVSGELLLSEIEANQKFASLIHNDEVLWGVLLGYGLHNAELYDERLKLDWFIYDKDLPKIPIKVPTPKSGFSTIEEESQSLWQKLNIFGGPRYSPLIAESIYFAADLEHPETKVLEKKYKKLRGRISAIYAQGDFLEITLSKLVSAD